MIDQYRVKNRSWEVEQRIYLTFPYQNKMRISIFSVTDVDLTVDLQLQWEWMKLFLGDKYKMLNKGLCIIQSSSLIDLQK